MRCVTVVSVAYAPRSSSVAVNFAQIVEEGSFAGAIANFSEHDYSLLKFLQGCSILTSIQ
jgi:hypothetical protein